MNDNNQRKWVTADDLVRFAKDDEAPRKLARFVKWLIDATPVKIVRARFLEEEAAAVHGLDGFLVCEGNDPYVPSGASVWEFGVSTKDAKATKDARSAKSKAHKEGIDAAKATLIIVTLQKWPGRTRWLEREREKQGKKGGWGEIRAYNAVDLAAWLESKRSVALRVAKEVGLIPPGVEDPESYWGAWLRLSSFPVTERILFAGRQTQVDQFLTDLVGEPKMHVLRADSPREALAFAIAAIHSAGAHVRKGLLSRTLIADDETVVRRLTNQRGLIVAVRGFAGELPDTLVRQGNHLIVPIGADLPGLHATVTLSRSRRKDFTDALIAEGMDSHEAERRAVGCSASATLLQRTLIVDQRKVSGIISPPSWATGHEQYLVPAMLAGGWDESLDADKAVMASLAGMPYAQLEAGLQKLLTAPEPPIVRIGHVWKITAPTYCFHELARFITSSQLEALETQAITVFSEINPRYELDPKDRGYSDKRLAHSGWVRDGIAETLLLVSIRGAEANIACGVSPQAFVEKLVSRLPGLSENWRSLASLRGQLTSLMEAAPDPLLSALERMLEGDGAAIRGLFGESEFITPDSPHTGVLWALEMMGWDPEYFPRVALILAALARVDPGGRLANRPIRSLAGLFLFWHPKTNAPYSLRLEVLDNVLQQEPTVGWQLLMQLVPNHSGFTMESNGPRWREAGEAAREQLTGKLQYDAASAFVDRAIARIGVDPVHWHAILDKVQAFTDTQREQVYAALEKVVESDISPNIKEAIWKSARDLLHHHRAFAETDWALPANELERIAAVVGTLTPEDPIERHLWLFEQHFLDLPEKDFGKAENQSNHIRLEAVTEILDRCGIDGLMTLANRARMPGLVGYAAAESTHNTSQLGDMLLTALDKGEASGELFASALSVRALQLLGEHWSNYIVERAREEKWEPKKVANLFKFWAEQESTWSLVESFGPAVAEEFWKTKPVFAVTGPVDDLVFAVRRLIGAERAASALSIISLRVKDVPTNVLYEALEGTLTQKISDQAALNMLSHCVQTNLEALSERDDADGERTAKIEIAFFELIRFDNRKLVLYRLMSKFPSLVLDLVKALYKPETGREDPITEQEKTFAGRAWQILEGWQVVPGTTKDGKIDQEALFLWVDEARKLGAAAHRSKMLDYEIGKVLAHAPLDPTDKSWPHRAVRNLIESKATEDLERGIQIEDFNKRGVFTKSMFEGGGQERTLAEERVRWAESLRRDWPRTSKLLSSLARSWDEHAKDADVRAKKDELRF